jgi:uncharacterized peroxidase-related enzyme
LIIQRRHAARAARRPWNIDADSDDRGADMPFFPSLDAEANVGDLYKLNPETRQPMSQLGRIIMRGESPLTSGQREMIAAFVSGLNKCDYCFGGHSQVAVNLGIDRAVFAPLFDDIDTAPVDDKLKPILRFVKKLTLEPRNMNQSDADAVFAAGWSERALHDAILVCARFNYMNRLALGHGLDPQPEDFERRAKGMSYATPKPS